MKTEEILRRIGIGPNMHIFCITTEEALDNLCSVISDYCPHIDLTKISRKDMLKLLSDYGSCVVLYNPEDNHQERAAILQNADILRKYGLTDEDIAILDFC